ncbi:MAG: Gfo/Idh/MocA family oxidoreductase, partial [Myxococcales bacterium]|nr:Gfo/Idh/MocA family oxidoreductase [Myxococcales bacterium]
MQVAVIGAGRFGSLHAVKLAAVPGVRVAAVVDLDPARAAAAAARVPGALALTDLDALAPGVVAATVAVDVPRLAGVTARLLDRGLHVLAEKPLAMHADAAERLQRLAERRGRVLAVGFVER